MYFRYRQCYDPRDKIYGLLGLCDPQKGNEISPSYLVTTSSLYQKVVLNAIRVNHSLEIFSQLGPRSSKVDRLTNLLPSWVPNWMLEMEGYQFNALQSRLHHTHLYTASKNSRTSFNYHPQGHLALKGVFLYPLEVIGSKWDPDYVLETCAKWREIAGIPCMPQQIYDIRTQTTYYEAYCQTICASTLLDSPYQKYLDLSARHDWSLSLLLRVHDLWWKSLELDQKATIKLDLNPDIFNTEVVRATCFRSMFLCKNGTLMGLAPMYSKIGDKIALLEGGAVPYVLRPTTGIEHGHYEIVGEAYIHGFMGGEAWDRALREDIVLV